MRKYLLFIILLSGLCIDARGQSDPEIDLSGLPQATTAKSLRYWFDNGSAIMTTTTLTGATTINASSLKEGVHIVHYQIVDSKNIAGIPDSKMFIKLDSKITAKSASLRYWFDTDDNTTKTTKTLSGATTIDASALVEGIHTVHYQIIDDQGIANITDSKMFIKLDAKVNAKASKLQYWFDTDKKTLVETDLAETQNIDASKLVEGIHTVHYQIVDDKGNIDIPVSALFIKLDKKTVAEATAVRYWFDEDDANAKEGAITTEVQVVDASKLSKGEHEIHYQLVAANGEVFPIRSASFENAIKALLGDANDDKTVNIADIVTITNHIMGHTSEEFKEANADADENGIIDANDIATIVGLITGKVLTWTKVGTGTFSYTVLWGSADSPLVKSEYELFLCDGTDNVYKIAKWGDGSGVDYIFTWDKETNKCSTQMGLAGYTHSTYGEVSVVDICTYDADKAYDNYPSRYVPEENKFYFFNSYVMSAGSFNPSAPETFEVEWDAPAAARPLAK